MNLYILLVDLLTPLPCHSYPLKRHGEEHVDGVKLTRRQILAALLSPDLQRAW